MSAPHAQKRIDDRVSGAFRAAIATAAGAAATLHALTDLHPTAIVMLGVIAYIWAFDGFAAFLLPGDDDGE